MKTRSHFLRILWRRICLSVPFLRYLLGMPRLVVFIRHAESQKNEALGGKTFFSDSQQAEAIGSIADHRIAITEKGRKQARQAGLLLCQRYGIPDMLIHSGYTRTIQTSHEIIRAYPPGERLLVKVESNFLLRERDSGHGHPLTQEEAEQTFPHLQKYWKIMGPFFSRPPGGESLADLLGRLKGEWQHLRRRFAGKRLFIVSHGRVIQCFRMYFDQMDIDQIEAFLEDKQNTPKNCSLMAYRYDVRSGKLALAEYNTIYQV